MQDAVGSGSARTPGLTNLLSHDFARRQIWFALVALALDLIAWTLCSHWGTTPAPGTPSACGCCP